ncbi:MAG: pyridine nucleotide-disulfide oxidoreductase, partial [Lachnospiraceae bacterium]|nr:pyridine nucleotide-disulfide oxidoreductase [Lachnospiraceae bacterium]
PSTISINRMEDLQTIRFRVADVYKNCSIVVSADGCELVKLKKQIVAPGEMEQVILKKQLLIDKNVSESICIELVTE